MSNIAVIVVVVCFLVLILWLTVNARLSIYKKFNINFIFYRLLHHDLGGKSYPGIQNKYDIGRPDAIFKHRFINRYCIGEFKSRRYKNKVRYSEFIQLQIYLGIYADLAPKAKLIGVIAYADSAQRVAYYPKIYKALTSYRAYLQNSKAMKLPPAFQDSKKELFASIPLSFVEE